MTKAQQVEYRNLAKKWAYGTATIAQINRFMKLEVLAKKVRREAKA